MEDAEKTKEQLISELTSLRQQVTDFEHCKTEMVAEALRASEKKYRIIFDNAPIGIFRTTVDGRLLDANRELCRMLGYLSPQEMIATTNQTSVSEALYIDPELRPNLVLKKALANRGEWDKTEVRLRRSDGKIVTVWLFFHVVSGEEPAVIEGFCEDISERKRMGCLLRLQRDLARGLGAASTMDEAMELLLHSAMQIDGIDAGGVYVLEASHKELRLGCHAGLSPWFINQVSSYGPDTPHMRLVMQGEPVYRSDVRGFLGVTLLEDEGLTSLAVIPIIFDGQLVAVLNLASRAQKELNEHTKQAIEAIAAGIGGIVFRVQAEETLSKERKNLEEANTALKVILRHREEDHRELEESLLANVKSLVMPYVEQIMATRLSSDQMLLMEIIDSNLAEIASPFLRRISQPLLKLTPMETRVADLIRTGRTTKEIAAVLHTSVRSVQFHRESIRGKLGIKSTKVNLRSYLCSLA